MFFKLFGSCRVDTPSKFTGDEINVLADEEITVSYSNFLLSSKRDMYTEKLANFLSNKMGVPEDEQPIFIEKRHHACVICKEGLDDFDDGGMV